MAQIASGTSGIANLDVNALQTLINNVRARLVADKTIRAQDMKDIVNTYNALIQHNHTVVDTYYVAFGNKAPRASYSENRISEIPGFQAFDGSGIISGGAIVTNAIRDLASLINLFKTHGHSIIDNTY